jgi:hypothetical protein
MKDHQASATAESMALIRAFETQFSNDIDAFNDPYAKTFLSKKSKMFLSICNLRSINFLFFLKKIRRCLRLDWVDILSAGIGKWMNG